MARLDFLTPRPSVLVGTDVAEAARRRGATPVLEPGTLGLPGAVEAGLIAAGEGPVLILMADLPCPLPSDLDALVSALRASDVAIAPDSRGENTNALALHHPRAMRTFFGTGSSLGKYLTEAALSGLRASAVSTPGLWLDVDDQGDLDAALACGSLPLLSACE